LRTLMRSASHNTENPAPNKGAVAFSTAECAAGRCSAANEKQVNGSTPANSPTTANGFTSRRQCRVTPVANANSINAPPASEVRNIAVSIGPSSGTATRRKMKEPPQMAERKTSLTRSAGDMK